MILPFLLAAAALAAADPKREAEALMASDPAAESAGKWLERAVASNPQDGEAWYLLSRWAIVRRQYARAGQAGKQAAALSTGNNAAGMQAWTIVALASDQMNKPAEAEAAFRKALGFNRSLPRFDPGAAYEFVKLLEREERNEEAYTVAEVILRKSPDYGPAHLSRAKFLATTGKPEEAIGEAEFALAHPAGDRTAERGAHYLLARLYLRLKRTGQAEVHNQWLDANP